MSNKLLRCLAAIAGLAVMVNGCASTRPLKGGAAVTATRATGTVEQSITQSENPAQVSRQDQETVKVKSYTVPAGSRIEEARVVETKRGPVVTNVQSVTVSAPMPVEEREETRARTELGAAQKDTARELGAKLSSLKGIVWVGLALFLFGLASFVWPPLRMAVGSVTTSAAMAGGGLALMVLPTLVVGHELLILGAVGLGVAGWFLAHRHGKLQGLVDASRNEVPAPAKSK